ncbi:hypothetical protein DPMN_093712 [Dreissena polymorpha]|uniref:Uncharacterized protein n=1 Tax=Dreissena polymorpha TaxID=45954 RepID=A0A9D4R1Z7_DREPO|nr:hypothetical protein DPMN_093712 [Dreissena polymorpha]
MEQKKIHDAPKQLKSSVWKHFGFYQHTNSTELDRANAICKARQTYPAWDSNSRPSAKKADLQFDGGEHSAMVAADACTRKCSCVRLVDARLEPLRLQFGACQIAVMDFSVGIRPNGGVPVASDDDDDVFLWNLGYRWHKQ